MNDSMKVIAAMFLIRERDARKRGDHSAAVAYANAYDWVCYAVENNDDCLSQFDGYDEANEFLKKINFNYLWEMEDLIQKGE